MNAELKRIVDAAERSGACVGGLDKIRACGTVGQAMASGFGPAFATWYATKVAKARCRRMEACIRRDAGCWKLYKAAMGM